jgi:TolB protein
LVDWSGDGHLALFTYAPAGSQPRAIIVDLTNDRTDSSFPMTQGETVGFTRPTGQAILTSCCGTSPASVQRIGYDGQVQLQYPSTFAQVGKASGSISESPDGTQLAVAATGGIAVIGNDGTVITQLPGSCTGLVRWLDQAALLARCGGDGGLWEVPVPAGAPTRLTAPKSPQDFGDENLWTLPTGTFSQATGACGYQYVARVAANGTTSAVNVPGVSSGDSAVIDGAADGELAIQAEPGCGAGSSLLWFNPSTDKSRVVLGPTVNGGSVSEAILYASEPTR